MSTMVPLTSPSKTTWLAPLVALAGMSVQVPGASNTWPVVNALKMFARQAVEPVM